MNKLAITAIISATALVAGIFAFGPSVFTPKAEAQVPSSLPAKSVQCDDTSITPVTPNGEIARTVPQFVQHWDKIMFTLENEIKNAAGVVVLPADTELDIKVLDDPTEISNVKEKVQKFISDKTSETVPLDEITIKDIEYAIICAPAP